MTKQPIIRAATTPEKARVIVKRGVKLLDAVKPGWAKKINLAKFDLGDEKRCVLGYVYRDFFDGVYALAKDAAKANVPAVRHKLPAWLSGCRRVSATYYGFSFQTNAHAEHLAQEWKRVIARRQKALEGK